MKQLGDAIHLRGYIELALKDARTGKVLERQAHNTVVTAGRAWVLKQICSDLINTAQSITHIAVGTGTAAPATSDTALASETTRVAIGTYTTSNLTSNPPSWQASVILATNEGNTTLAEAGLLNSSSGGTLLGHGTFSTVNKTTSNTLEISYTISN